MGSIPVGATFYSESINRYQWIEYLGSAETGGYRVHSFAMRC